MRGKAREDTWPLRPVLVHSAMARGGPEGRLPTAANMENNYGIHDDYK